ncbi:MAG: glycosyltransferase [Dongiaceae bacterium]
MMDSLDTLDVAPDGRANIDLPNVLWVCRSIPFPLNAGDRVYSARLAEAVAAAGTRLTGFGLRSAETVMPRDSGQVEWIGIDASEKGTISALAGRLPLVTERCSPSAAIAAFQDLYRRKNPDVVVIDNYAAGWVLRQLPRGAGRPKVVYVAHNHEEELAMDIARDFTGSWPKKVALQLNAQKIAQLERVLVASSDLVVTLTPKDRDGFAARRQGKPISVLPPGYTGSRRATRVINESVPRRVVMVGSVRWIAKQMNVAEFLAAADRKFADAGIAFDIIGDVAEEFKESWNPKLKATRFLGFVDDLDRTMNDSRLGLIIEATGGGFKLKLLDYLFSRVPIAALEGSFEGVPEDVAKHFIIKPNAADLADTIIGTIDKLDVLNEMQDSSYRAAEGLFDWRENGRQFVEALRHL